MGDPKFTIKRASDGRYYFTLTDENGAIILTSELYASAGRAEGGVASAKSNAVLDESYDRHHSGTYFYFLLKAANGEVIGTSEMYSSQLARETAVDTVKRNAPIASVQR